MQNFLDNFKLDKSQKHFLFIVTNQVAISYLLIKFYSNRVYFMKQGNKINFKYWNIFGIASLSIFIASGYGILGEKEFLKFQTDLVEHLKEFKFLVPFNTKYI